MAEKKPVYIRCPRCELNYCLKKDKYCSVCKAEMSGDAEALMDDLDLELCPICKTNYIQPDEIMCATCIKEREANGESIDSDKEWEEYMNRDDEEYVMDDEETGDMASVSEIDDDILGGDLDADDLTFPGFVDDDEDGFDDEEYDEVMEDDFEKLDESDIEFDDDELEDDEDY